MTFVLYPPFDTPLYPLPYKFPKEGRESGFHLL